MRSPTTWISRVSSISLLFPLAGCPAGKEPAGGGDSGPADSAGGVGLPEYDSDGDGVPIPVDCDDADPLTWPGAPEIVGDEVDEDCDGQELCYQDIDIDDDDYATDATVVSEDLDCADPGEAGADRGGDCDDADPTVYPGAVERPDDGSKNDCTGTASAVELTWTEGRNQALRWSDARWVGASAAGGLGGGVAGAGDLDGDRLSDVLVAAPYEVTAQASDGPCPSRDCSGVVYVASGVAGSLPDLTSPDATFRVDTYRARLGAAMAGGCDADGDGLADVVIAASQPTWGGGSGVTALLLGPLSGTLGLDDADGQMVGAIGGQHLGAGVSCAGDVDGDGLSDLLVGAPGDEGGGWGGGAAFLLLSPIVRDVTSDDAEGKFLGSVVNGGMGDAVAMAGDVDGDGLSDLLIGSSVADAAWVFLADARGVVSPGDADAALAGEDEVATAGAAVASAGDVNGDGLDDLLIGAPSDCYVCGEVGRAYLVLGGATAMTDLSGAEAKIIGDDPEDLLGGAVAGAGDVDADGLPDLLVGAPGALSQRGQVGSALLYRSPISGSLSPDDADARFFGEQPGDRAGVGVAGLGDVDGDGRSDLLIGAEGFDKVSDDVGVAYVWLGGDHSADADHDGHVASEDCDDHDVTRWPGAPERCEDGVVNDCDGALADAEASCVAGADNGLELVHGRINGEHSADGAGSALSAPGDVNGDGTPDLLIGAPYSDGGGWSSGAAFLVLGPSGGPHDLGEAQAKLVGEEGSEAGSAVSSAGDVDGDGWPDVIVGGPELGGSEEGAAWVALGPLTGTLSLSTAEARVDGEAGDLLGCSVAGGGDLDGDGYDDVLVGANQDGVYGGAGVVLVLQGPVSGGYTPEKADALLAGINIDHHAGSSVTFVNDLDGDGLEDMAIAEGNAVWLFHGSVAGSLDLSDADTVLEGGGDPYHHGLVLASLGDADGDGLGDLLVGDPYTENYGDYGGVIFMVLDASAAAIELKDSAALLLGEKGLGWAGSSVASAGDVNADGQEDLLIGAPFFEVARPRAGAAYLVLGPVSGSVWLSRADRRYAGQAAYDNAGQAVAGPGDLDGDGYDDLAVGARYAWGGGESSGAVYLLGGILKP